jgi:anti-anti-sigma factor
MLLTAFNLTEQILDSDKVQALAKRFGGDGLQLDFGKVKSVTAAGLGDLVVLHKHLRAKGGGLLLSHVDESVYRVFEVTQLTRVLDIRKTVSWREEIRSARKRPPSRARKRRRAMPPSPTSSRRALLGGG